MVVQYNMSNQWEPDGVWLVDWGWRTMQIYRTEKALAEKHTMLHILFDGGCDKMLARLTFEDRVEKAEMSNGRTPTLQAKSDRLIYHPRLALNRLVEDVRRFYIDGFSEPIRSRLLYSLREEGEI
jgi:hypothetical protein